MKLPRFKEKSVGFSSQLSASENEAHRQSVERSNAMKRTFNKILDNIDKPTHDSQETEKDEQLKKLDMF